MRVLRRHTRRQAITVAALAGAAVAGLVVVLVTGVDGRRDDVGFARSPGAGEPPTPSEPIEPTEPGEGEAPAEPEGMVDADVSTAAPERAVVGADVRGPRRSARVDGCAARRSGLGLHRGGSRPRVRGRAAGPDTAERRELPGRRRGRGGTVVGAAGCRRRGAGVAGQRTHRRGGDPLRGGVEHGGVPQRRHPRIGAGLLRSRRGGPHRRLCHHGGTGRGGSATPRPTPTRR